MGGLGLGVKGLGPGCGVKGLAFEIAGFGWGGEFSRGEKMSVLGPTQNRESPSILWYTDIRGLWVSRL